MTEQNPSTPPWGEDFDADRAWKLIQALRTEKTDLQEKLATATTDLDTERQAREAAEKTVGESEQKITDATERAEKAEHGLIVEKAVRTHGVPEDLVEFLTGTPEEIEAKALRLSKIGKPEAPADGEKPADEKPADDAGRPKPALTPGHGGNDAPVVDTDAIVADIRGKK